MLITTILCYFIKEHCQIAIDEYNEKCKQIVKQTNYLSRERIQFVIETHHQICSRIKSYNHFCSKFYFVNFVSIFPASLFALTIFFQLIDVLWLLLFLIFILL